MSTERLITQCLVCKKREKLVLVTSIYDRVKKRPERVARF